jgi:hypothetical protein
MAAPLLPDIFWKGASGTRYGYWIYTFDRSMQNAAGNYIYAKKVNGLWQAVFVGECEDLAAIATDGALAECVKRNGATHIHTHTTPAGTEKRLAEAADLREGLKPPCNAGAAAP